MRTSANFVAKISPNNEAIKWNAPFHFMASLLWLYIKRYGCSLDRCERSHHFVVLVIQNVAVPDVAGTDGGIERIEILASLYAVKGRGDWCPTYDDAHLLARIHFECVLPSDLVGIGGDGLL
jgi:hypothetical protein